MLFSMNGWRRGLNGSIRNLKSQILEIISDCDLEGMEQDLKDAMDSVIRETNIINWVSYEGDEDFKEMGEISCTTFDSDENGDT